MATHHVVEERKTQVIRVTCEQNGRLIATITEFGLEIWCLYHKRPELISKERCLEAWAKGEGVQCTEEHGEAC